jgi:hypothetical protein
VSAVISKAAIHCVGPARTGYSPFLQTINAAGRRLSLIKCRDDFGAMSEPLSLWPEIVTIGAFTQFDRLPFDWSAFEKRALLNPQVQYWEVLNEDDASSTYAAKADLYISLVPKFKARGWGMGLFSCSSGTPPYPIEDNGVAYREIERACRYMIDNDMPAILCLHEYQSSGGTIERYKVLADYLQQRGALLPIAITEYGFETHPGDDLFMAMVQANDPIYMADDRVIGCALWTLGGGGWSGSNFQTALPLLGEYIATVPDIDPEPIPMTTILFGLHSPASAGDITTLELSAVDLAQKFGSYKFLTGDSPNHYAAIAAHGITLSNCMTRLSMDMRNRPKPTPAQFCNDMSLAISEAMTAGVRYFEVHNEPNIQSVEWPWSSDPHDFITWILEVIPLLRQQHPGIKLISPGLAPAENTLTWWQEFAEHEVFTACDAIGAHVYWPNRATMLTQAQGLHFIPLLQYASTTKPIFVTELSNNINADADYEKGLQYVDWCSHVASHYPLVTRSYWYVLQSDTQSDNDSRQTLVRGGVVTQIANGIRDGVFNPVQPVEYVYQHAHVDGGAPNTSKTISIVMDRAHTIQADYAPIAPVVNRFPLTISMLPAGAGAYTVTPASVDGLYDEGTIVTVVFA